MSQDDVNYIKEGLRKGTIDIIATDHAPHEFTSKDVEFDLATFGISGFETALALSLGLVREDILDLKGLLMKMTANPANLLGLEAGVISEGAPADIIVFDPEYGMEVATESPSPRRERTPPSTAMTLRGRNLFTMVDGTNRLQRNGIDRF